MKHAPHTHTHTRTRLNTHTRTHTHTHTLSLSLSLSPPLFLPPLLLPPLQVCMTAALGFDSYVAMRHGVPGPDGAMSAGCYFCNDGTAPQNVRREEHTGGRTHTNTLALQPSAFLALHPTPLHPTPLWQALFLHFTPSHMHGCFFLLLCAEHARSDAGPAVHGVATWRVDDGGRNRC